MLIQALLAIGLLLSGGTWSSPDSVSGESTKQCGHRGHWDHWCTQSS